MLFANICKRLLGAGVLLAAFGFTTLNAQTVAYVANSTSNTVSVIDTASNTITGSIAVGNNPSGVVFSPDGARAFVTNSADSTVSVIDTALNTVVSTINLPGSTPSPLAITPDGKTLYVPDSSQNAVFVIDTVTNTVRGTIFPPGANQPVSIAVTPDGLLAYVLNMDGTVLVLDVATNTQQGNSIVTNSYSPFIPLKIVIAADGRIYVPGGAYNEVGVITGGTATSIPLPDCGFPLGLAVTPDSARIYEACAASGTVAVFDANSPPPATAPTFIALAGSPNGQAGSAAVTPDGASVYVTDFDGVVFVIATATNTVVATIPVGGNPFIVAIAKLPVLPTAVAGPNQKITAGQTVHLDGSGSFAPNTLPANLQYSWSFVSQPGGSAASLNGADTAKPSFVAGAIGDYVAQLVVTDPATSLASKPSQVTVSSVWSPPMAYAGPAQSVATGALVHLTGLGSSDPNGLPLTYAWSLVAKPSGSAAAITPGTLGLASFTPDVAGPYKVMLVVSDAFGSSQPSTMGITATTPKTAEQLLQEAITLITAMPAESFDAGGHSKALTNYLQQAIDDIQQDKTSQAIDKVNDAIIRTDGVPLRTRVDGNGIGMDWITNADDQNAVYEKLKAALDLLQPAQ